MCEECYASHSRATPLLHARQCLENHEQYICGTCGRCICLGKDEKRGLQRWNFPFRTLAIARLYLRAANAATGQSCGIYEIQDPRRRFYKIFADGGALAAYLAKNKGKACPAMAPVFSAGPYRACPGAQVRRLTPAEVARYLEEQAVSASKA